MRTNRTCRCIANRLFIAAVLAFSTPSVRGLEADPALYLEHVKFLAAPERQGRNAGSKGLQDAANYIAKWFQKYDLQPIHEEGSFFQTFPVTAGAAMGDSNRFTVHSDQMQLSLHLGEDYIPLSFSSSGSVTGPLAFAGYGAVAEKFRYDDYKNFDVEGKIVVLIRYEPKHFSENSDNERHTHHAHLITKAIEARNRGAKAVLLVNGNLKNSTEDLLLKFGAVSGPDDAGILIAQVKNELVNGWLQTRGETLAGIQATIDSSRQPNSFSFGESLQVSVEIDINRKKTEVHNVVGYLPGKSTEYVVLGAHYDHLGLGAQYSLTPRNIGQVHPGADDNASGTAGLLELARIFAARVDDLERGILFLAFAGEEIGLLGSSYWVNHPTLALDDAVAMLNMDMIGRVKDRRVYLGGAGTGTGLEELITRAGSEHEFRIEISKSGYGASDHTSFAGKNVPVLFFFSGLHSDYHKPSDTWDKIDSNSAAEIVNLISDVSTQLLETKKRPKFVSVKRAAHGNHTGGTGDGYGPWFGSIPDFGQIEKGVKFSDIQPGSPASQAGIKANDILIQFGSKPVSNLYDFTHALRAHKVGDVVVVKVLREGRTRTAKVILGKRR